MKEAYLNPFTGKDNYAPDLEGAKGRGIFKKYVTYPLNHNALWVTTSEPTRKQHFLSVLTAKKGAEAYMPELKFEGESKVTLVLEDGSERSVSFDPKKAADIMIDLGIVREHFEETGL